MIAQRRADGFLSPPSPAPRTARGTRKKHVLGSAIRRATNARAQLVEIELQMEGSRNSA